MDNNENNSYRRNRKKSPDNFSSDDGSFDWEEYDLRTSGTRRSRREQKASAPENKPVQQKPKQAAPPPPRKKSRKKKEKPENPARKLFMKRLRIAILLVVFVGVIVCTGVGVGMYAAVSSEIRDMNIHNLALNYSSFIYYNDENGNAQQLEQINSSSNRIWVDSEEIPQVMKDAIVSIEDERFYQHHGVDVRRTIGATVKWGLHKIGIGSASYGGSTITQQVIKNITNETKKTPTRKIKEMMRAVALEKQLSKDEILTMYLNIVFFANNCYGVEAASNVYYNKSVGELSLPQAAAIAGITQTPAKYDPYAHPDNTIEKRNRVLGKMLELGKITEVEYQNAVNAPLGVTTDYKQQNSQVASYFVDQVMNDVISDLQTKKGYSESFATQQVTNGGLKIYSTVDVSIQDDIESVFTNSSNFPQISKQAQAAMIIMDPYTGQVKGLVGGMGKKTDSRGWNRATQAKRQPGSAIKPLSAYAPGLEMNKINESTVIEDEEITIGADNWKPKNSYSGFKGNLLLKQAVEISANIPAVKVVDMLGTTASFNFLQNKFHISSLDEKDKNYSSLALGGLTTGISPREMAAAYCTFVNSGKYIKPYTYTKVVDSTGRVLLENRPDTSQAISPATAYITSDLLYEVVNGNEGTGRGAKLSNMPTYGKTGTTNDDFDKWFVGYTPYYVGAVWYGFDTPESIKSAGVSSNPAVKAWKQVMEKVHDGLDQKELAKPVNVVSADICTISGLLATSRCEPTTAYFVEGSQPKTKCYNHKGGTFPSASPSGSSNPSSTKPATAKPSATAGATQKPEETATPKKTTAPEPSKTPERTKAPEKTTAPERTKTPERTSPPEGNENTPEGNDDE